MTQALAEKSWTVALRAPTAEDLEIVVYDVIGQDFFGEGVTAQAVVAKLREAPKAKKITLRVNSVGGVLNDAKAMVNLLAERASAGVEIVGSVDGIAASAAAYLLTACSRVEMPSNGFQMVHGGRVVCMGTADVIEARAALLRRENDQMAEAFAAASSRRGKAKTKDDFLAAFAKGDLYLDADQAIDWGLADTKIEPLKVAACLADVTSLVEPPEAVSAALYVTRAEAQVTPPVPVAPAAQPISPSPPVSVEPTTPSTGKESNMADKPEVSQFVQAITLALGLPIGSTESDLLARGTALANREKEVVTVTGAKSSDEAIGALRGIKALADEASKLREELTTVRGERDRQNFDTQVSLGKSDRKLDKAMADLYEAEFEAATPETRSAVVDRLRGHLKVLRPAFPAQAKQIAVIASGAGEQTYNGKTYAQLGPQERANLKSADPELSAVMRRDWEAAGKPSAAIAG